MIEFLGHIYAEENVGARLIQEGRADTAAYRDFLLNYSSALQATGLPQLFWLWVLAKNNLKFFITEALNDI